MYSITVFPKAQLKSGTGDDKRRIAPFATIGELHTVATFQSVVELASTHTVSLNEYKSSASCPPGNVHRHGDHFVRTNLIGLDIDDNILLTTALEKLRAKGWKFGVYTSFNHKPEANKFRVILELEDYITEPSIYRNTWESIHADFLGLDAQCKDVARLYFHSNPETRQVFIEDGSLVKIVREATATNPKKFAKASTTPTVAATDADGFESLSIRAKLPIEVRNWLTGIDEYGEPWQPQPGERSGLLYKLALLCKERGYSQDWCHSKLGARLRDDEDYLSNYGGLRGVNQKIGDTLDQVFSRDSRHVMPGLFTFLDLDSPREFVNSWLRSQTIEVNRNGIFYVGDKTWSPRALLNTITLDYDEQYRRYNKAEEMKPKEDQRKVRKLSKDSLEAAIAEYVDVKRNDHKVKLMEAIKFCGNSGNLSELRKFAFVLTGKDDEACVAVLAHFIWQVKRKVFGLKVQYHMMPILTGVQGNGKSTAIRQKFLSPVDDFIATPTLADLADRRHYEAYQFNYVVFCDEMEQADSTDVDGLKNFITAERQTAREMYSTTMLEFRQNCTPIGCTNKSLATLIYDPTGMRRFYEIATDSNMPDNWKELDRIDYKKMWQQVDENIPGPSCYIMPLKLTIETHQEQLRVQDPIELFLDESGAAMTPNAEILKVKASEFYADYKMFCARNGHKTKASNWFGTKLKDHKIESTRKRIDGKLNHVYLVNATYTPLFELTP
jgi:hypothetical protein